MIVGNGIGKVKKNALELKYPLLKITELKQKRLSPAPVKTS